MPSYTTILVLALAATNVSPALSAPILLVREQSLSHRRPKIGAAPSKRAAWGPLLKKIGIELGIGTASTVAGYGLLDTITGPSASSSQEPAAPVTVPASQGSATPSPATPPPGNQGSDAPPPGNQGSAPPSPAPPPPGNQGSTPGPGTSSTTPAANSNNGNTANNANNSNNSNNGNSASPQSNTGSGSSIFDRSISNKNRRATSALELLSRTDLEKGLKLFKRILDELD